MKPAIPAAALAALLAAAPAPAEITRTTDDSFVSRHEVVVEATPKEVWLALISPAAWWRSEHTWSGDSKNLSLMPSAGGCFCETIPEVDEPGRFTLEGSVEHMRVVQAYPESALRMVGALGPLQSEPVTGVLTIAISKTPKGTKIVWEYNVGGPMRYEIPVISKAVDGVMGAQLEALAKPLKVVPMPKPPAAPAPAPAPAAATPAPVTSAPGAAATKPPAAPAPAVGRAPLPTPAAKPAPKIEIKPDAKPARNIPSVAETFGDVAEPPKR
ncbi:SRPBCC family protein [Erythrobacter donghaensis]|uniref:SRPBCC family protein n=1 Tax=Erythrobacter donghaensis TaxID=267135 RepID=UPI001B803795|nr:SRPBCC family protein [Erythrobacter donghaensis]